jgi:hypothetical protein
MTSICQADFSTSLSRNGSATAPGEYQVIYKQQFSKTALCKFFAEGTCTKGAACSFAHSPSELMPKPVLTKTRLCKDLLKNGACTNSSCCFAHEVVEVERTNSFFRSKLCQYGASCKVGDNCRYAHSVDELRAPVIRSLSLTSSDFGLDSPDDGFPLRKGSSFASTRGSSGALVALTAAPTLVAEVKRHNHFSETYLD